MDAWKNTQYPLSQSWEERATSDDRKDARYGFAFVSLVVAIPVLLIALVVLVYAGFAVAS
ncbi:ABC-type glycerol-3-phosphate transport system permease component [Stenotrophomonas sp. BIGb0135]|nr:ABC-type glycerol-3-phosphate transport system permease component [Stenotrophomonas sp. BIGb0135]